MASGVMSAKSVRIDGDGLSTDVLPGPRSQGVIERVLIGVDEEVDRFILGDAQELAGRRHRVLADLQRPLPERVAALVPVDADDVAGRRLPIEALVVVDVP